MTNLNQATLSRRIAKAVICVIIIVMLIPGITLLTLASVVIWFYGEEAMTGQVMRHFSFVEKFLPAVMTETKED
jgi:hypothetical protein